MVFGLCRQGSKLPTYSLPPQGALARAQARSRNRMQRSAICIRRLPTNHLVQIRVSGVDNWEIHAPKTKCSVNVNPRASLASLPADFSSRVERAGAEHPDGTGLLICADGCSPRCRRRRD
jgi:hypothetical protein